MPDATVDLVEPDVLAGHGWMGPDRTIVDYSRIQVDRTKELSRWSKTLRGLAKRVKTAYGYVNNHFAGHSPASIRMLQEGLAPDGRYYGVGGRGACFCGSSTAGPPCPAHGSAGSGPTTNEPSLHLAVAPAGGSSDRRFARAATGSTAAGPRTGWGGGAGVRRGSTCGSGTGAGRTESTGAPVRLIGCGALGCSTARTAARACPRGATDDGGALGATGGRSAGTVSRVGRASGGPACAASGCTCAPRISAHAAIPMNSMGASW